jgi:hypothetical protein
MLTLIFSYHQVMPNYIDFISVFGLQLEAQDLRFSGFLAHSTISIGSPQGLVISSLGRSGRIYQMCYNLKTVSCISDPNSPPKEREWSIQPAAFYHHFDVEEGTALWISTKGRLADLKDQVQDLTGKDGRPEDRSYDSSEESFRSSLAVHLLYCNWSTEGWHSYIKWLELMVDQEVSH